MLTKEIIKEVHFKPPLPHQRELWKAKEDYVVMACGRGAGKTWGASLLIAKRLLAGERLLVFAQNYGALTENMFMEVRKRLAVIFGSWDSFKYNKGSKKIEVPSTGGVLYGLTYENIEACRGYTEINAVILDEGALAPANILETVVPCCRGRDKFGMKIEPQIYITTTPRAGTWFNAWIEDKLKNNPSSIRLIRAKSVDNKYNTDKQRALAFGAFTNKALLSQEMEGEILNLQAENSILAGVEYRLGQLVMPTEGWLNIGIDGSGYGKDKTVITYRIGNSFYQECYDKIEGFELRNKIKSTLRIHKDWKLNGIAIDMAYGEKYYENLYQEYENVELLNFASNPTDDQYANLRAEMYFNLVEAIRNGLFINENIKKELDCTLFEFNNRGKLKLVNKDEIKLVLGHSPDESDSLALTYALATPSTPVNYEEYYYGDPNA
jgi:hypothetical protein